LTIIIQVLLSSISGLLLLKEILPVAVVSRNAGQQEEQASEHYSCSLYHIQSIAAFYCACCGWVSLLVDNSATTTALEMEVCDIVFSMILRYAIV
jgi:hypothetical protein